MTTVVRPVRPSDGARLGALAGELVRLHHRLDPARFISGEGIDQGYGRWLLNEAERGATVLVAEGDGGRVVGYAYATLEARNWVDLIDAHGKLHDVFVDPAARRSGVARALVVAAIEALRVAGAPRLILSTAAQNEAARAFFRTLGFAPSMVEMMRLL